MGTQSCKLGLSSTVISVNGLGIRGARFIPALLMTITSVGWFGVQAAVCGASFSVIMAEVLDVSVPAWAAALFWGLVMGVFVTQGYRVLRQFFYYITVPVLSVVVIYTAIHTAFFSDAGSLSALLAWRPVEPMSYAMGITLVVGNWAMGAYVVGDYCRYTRKPRDVVLGISAGMIAAPVMVLTGAIFRIVTGSADIAAILNNMGYPAVALVFLILSTWAINVMNAYFGGIAFSVLLGFEEKSRKLSTAFTVIAGTALGAAGILSRFTDFLILLSCCMPPLIGVLAGAKIMNLLGRERKADDNSIIPSKPIGGGGGGGETRFLCPRDHRLRAGNAHRVAYHSGNSFFYPAPQRDHCRDGGLYYSEKNAPVILMR
jgi:cytosine permease